jgi:hypothetical protein
VVQSIDGVNCDLAVRGGMSSHGLGRAARPSGMYLDLSSLRDVSIVQPIPVHSGTEGFDGQKAGTHGWDAVLRRLQRTCGCRLAGMGKWLKPSEIDPKDAVVQSHTCTLLLALTLLATLGSATAMAGSSTCQGWLPVSFYDITVGQLFCVACDQVANISQHQ